MTTIEPYTIAVPDEALRVIRQKLDLAKLPDELERADWEYGAPLEDIRQLIAYWKTHFDWRKQEALLNRLPNFHTAIQIPKFSPLDIHFIHQRSPHPDSTPLLFVHGWPGSFIEVTKILPQLTDPPRTYQSNRHPPTFHVVAPSLPNFWFSSGVSERGFGLAQYAEVCHALMQRLGYTEYATQGGDWGCMITRTLSLLHPSACRATHVNMVRGHAPTLLGNPFLYLKHNFSPSTPRERAGFARSAWFRESGSGYTREQATKPQTLGYSLADSPVGLLAWIYEKLHDWTDAYSWTPDEVLTWISIYAFSTAGPAASVRIYYESTHLNADTGNIVSRDRTEEWIGGGVKLGLSYFPRELTVVPMSWGRTMGDVVFEAVHDKGGHFAAWERPEELIADLRVMFGKGGGAEGAVQNVAGVKAML